MRLRAVYESARLGMFLRGFRSGSVAVGPDHPVHGITYLDGRHLVREEGRDQPLTVLIHGLGSSVATWSPVLGQIARTVPTVAPDLPGYGRSLLPEGVTHATYRQMVDATCGFLDAMHGEKVQLVGQSMGGWIAARVAAERPEQVARLTLVNCAGVLHPQVFEQGRLFRPENREELRLLWKSMWKRLPISYYLLEDEYMRVTQTNVVRGFLDNIEEDDFLNPYLSDIQAPTLLIWGLADRLISHESVPIIRKHVRDIRVREIPGCGHVPQREGKAEFLRYLLPWLRGEEPPEELLPALRAARAAQEA